MDEAEFQRRVAYTDQAFLSQHQHQFGETPAETRARIFRKVLPKRGRDDFLRDLIAESVNTKLAWDSVKLIAEDLLRDGEQLPDALAEWVADVLADIAKPRKDRRRPRPTKGGSPETNHYWVICGPFNTSARSTPCHQHEMAADQGNAALKVDRLAILLGVPSSGSTCKPTKTPSGFGGNAIRSCPTRRAKKARTTQAGIFGTVREIHSEDASMDDRLLCRREVEERTGLSRSAIYRLMREEKFPTPIKIGPRAVRWPQSEINEFIAARPRATGEVVAV